MEVKRVTSLREEDIAGRDFSFQISAVIAKPYHHLATDQDVKTTSVPTYSKTFEFDREGLASAASKESEKAIFTLNQDGDVFGYAHAFKDWNNMVFLDYIVLDVSIRGQGHGDRLFDAVVEWARELAVDGVRIEGQTNNVAACRFYKKRGLSFGGYDEFLYKGIPKDAHETAIFWYHLF